MDLTTLAMHEWPVRKAITLSVGTSPWDPEIRERMKRRKWDLGDKVSDAGQAIDILKSGNASVLIIEDSSDISSSILLRQCLYHEITFLRPTIVMISDRNKTHIPSIETMGIPAIIDQPTTPGKFIESFEELIFKWSTSYYSPIQEPADLIITGDNISAIKKLRQLSIDQALGSIAAPALALALEKLNQHKESERTLLNCLKSAPNNLGALLTLMNFYIKSAMPLAAKKVIHKINTIAAHPMSILIDQFQCHLMLNEIDQCIGVLKKINSIPQFSEKSNLLLARCLLSEGRNREYQKLLPLISPENLQKAECSWGKVS
ncbi:MAG: hypothetical protein CMP10_04640 [Zetaproteobacteria bacterium]|nr:hypothetical protein [Pseudobdellovibrionaceae bacterium]